MTNKSTSARQTTSVTAAVVIASLAYPFLGLGLIFASAFQAAGRPLWPVLAITGRAIVVALGGWVVIHLAGGGLGGLAVVAATGLAVYGGSLAIAFRTRVWQQQPKQLSVTAT